jgi:hypothetical protein
MTEEEIFENEGEWRAENRTRSKSAGGDDAAGSGMGSAPGLDTIGFRPSGDEDTDVPDDAEPDADSSGGDGASESVISGDDAPDSDGDNPL